MERLSYHPPGQVPSCPPEGCRAFSSFDEFSLALQDLLDAPAPMWLMEQPGSCRLSPWLQATYVLHPANQAESVTACWDGAELRVTFPRFELVARPLPGPYRAALLRRVEGEAHGLRGAVSLQTASREEVASLVANASDVVVALTDLLARDAGALNPAQLQEFLREAAELALGLADCAPEALVLAERWAGTPEELVRAARALRAPSC